jgi:hypothetical protein
MVWSDFLFCVIAQAMTIDDKTKATASANPALKIVPFLSVLICFYWHLPMPRTLDAEARCLCIVQHTVRDCGCPQSKAKAEGSK